MYIHIYIHPLMSDPRICPSIPIFSDRSSHQMGLSEGGEISGRINLIPSGDRPGAAGRRICGHGRVKSISARNNMPQSSRSARKMSTDSPQTLNLWPNNILRTFGPGLAERMSGRKIIVHTDSIRHNTTVIPHRNQQ